MNRALVRFKVRGSGSNAAFSVCRECKKANDAYFAAGGRGTRKIPTLRAGPPEAQSCEHLRRYVLSLGNPSA